MGRGRGVFYVCSVGYIVWYGSIWIQRYVDTVELVDVMHLVDVVR
jgi:hypothetical protein